MTHLVLGLLLMLVGAGLMAVGLYVRALGGARRAATAGTARPVSPRRRVATIVSSAIFLLLGLALVVVGIVVSLEPQTTAPR